MKAGTFVSWPASKGVGQGRVVSVHTGKVPGVVSAMSGSPETPAARVQLYAKAGKGWEASTVFLGMPVASLTTIDPLPEPPATDTATEAVTGSFDDIRQRVQAAIRERLSELTGTDVWAYVYDIGFSWAVYDAGSCDEMWMVEYSIADDGSVMLTDPTPVTKVVSYVPDADELDESGGEVEDDAAETVTGPDRIVGRLLGALGSGSDGGRVFEVQIIAYGMSLNGRNYSESVLRAAAPLYEGAAAFDHHRTDVELNTGTTVGIVGHYRNVKATETGLLGELHLLPSATHTAELLDQTLVNQAAGLPLLVGISHDALTTSKRKSENGRIFSEVTAIVAVNSADVVVSPAAGGMAMRTVAGGLPATTPTTTPQHKENTVTFKQLMALLRIAESAAERAALLADHAAVLEAAGLTGISEAEALRVAESFHTASRVAEGSPSSSDSKLAKGSAIAGLVVERTLLAAGLSPRLAESILGELGDQFTEAEIAAKIESHKRILEAAEKAGLAPGIQHVDVKLDSQDKLKGRLDAMFAGDYRNGFRSFKEAYMAFTGRQPGAVDGSDFNREILRESASFLRNGERVGFDAGDRSIESATTTTWALALGDSITRRMVAEYAQPSLSTWREIVSSIVPVQDFRTQRIERIGGYGVLPTVVQGAPYQPLTTPGNDTEPTYALTKRGGTEDLTLEAIANDDMRVIARIPTKLGLAAAQTIYRFVWDFFSTNPAIYDGVALFAGGHNNTATNALSGANLSAARKAMRKQTAYGDSSNLLSAVPKFLITVADLEELAFQLCTSPGAVPASAPVGGATDIPNIHQGVKPIVVDYWSSTTAWYVVADPAQIPTIELGFYQGKEDPELFVQADPTTGSYFNADKVTWKIRHIYSGAWLDFRSAQRGNA